MSTDVNSASPELADGGARLPGIERVSLLEDPASCSDVRSDVSQEHEKSHAPTVAKGHAVTLDQIERDKHQPKTAEYLRHASASSGRRYRELVREFRKLKRGPGKITLPEYVQYGVYDTDRHSPEEQQRFITNTLHWPITHACCDMTWQAATEDKWLCSHILDSSAVRVPNTLGVIDKTERAYLATEKISNGEQFRDFILAQSSPALFGKENRGICSFGVFQVLDANRQALLLKGEGWLNYDDFFNVFVGDTPYLLQETEVNHPFFEKYTDSVATIRLCILVTEAGIRIPFAVLKIPSQSNLADSFWRPGNLACGLDAATGEILTARSKDALGTTDHQTHPETGATLVGETVPLWDKVLELAHTCAPIFSPVKYQSMDIAVAPDGPVLIEINTGGGFDLPQLATGQGFLTDEVREFFRSCGYEKL